MPYSLVLNLVPLVPIPKTHLSGRHLHALFLDLVRSSCGGDSPSHNPTLATTLHGQTAQKAFTLSPLQTQLDKQQNPGILQWRHPRAIPANTPCWWRITLLDDSLFAQLAHLWLGLSNQQQWLLGGSPIQLTSVMGTQQASQPWASYLSYAQLLEQASDRNRKLPFRFCTPTNFRISDYDSCMPTRDRVFKSLLKRWNHYSGIPFSEDIIGSIYPSEYSLHSEIAIDSRSKFIGSVGNITFSILGDIFPSTIQQINALASFSLYSGVGRKTPMGMGQVFYAQQSVTPRVNLAKPSLKPKMQMPIQAPVS